MCNLAAMAEYRGSSCREVGSIGVGPYVSQARIYYNHYHAPLDRWKVRMSLKKWKNPFYTLLIPVGMVFVITAFAYGFLAFVEVNATNPEARAQSRQQLGTWLNAHGTDLLIWELGVLAILTVGAIATDHWWMRDMPHPQKEAEE